MAASSEGPPVYHRLESSTQTVAVSALQKATGEIWGTVPRYGDRPSVKAYPGRLPKGARGIEFTTEVSPDPTDHPRIVTWSGPRTGVFVDGNWARIGVTMLKNTQQSASVED